MPPPPNFSMMFTGLLQYHREFELVIQFLREVFRINHCLVVADDGVDVLKEHDPWHHGVGKPGASGFLVVFAEVSRGVEKLLWNDWRL
jgi:hypothetical protein